MTVDAPERPKSLPDQETTVKQPTATVKSEANTVDSDQVNMLRHALFGDDYDELIQFKDKLKNATLHTENVANVIAEAIAIRQQQDDSISSALALTIESTLSHSVQDNPRQIADALYPIIGPAIRKSITETLNQMLSSLNQTLEQSFSFKAILWRIEALLTGKEYTEVFLMRTLLYRVEQVFLIHQDTGLLLQHVTAEEAITKDADMVSGMLTAIQDFMFDSFEVGAEEQLSTLKLGNLTVLIDKGPHATLAAVVRGSPPSHLQSIIVESLESIHDKFSRTLLNYQGDSSTLDDCKPLLQACLLHQEQGNEKPKSRWKIYSLLAVLALVFIGYLTYNYYQEKRWQQAIEQFDQQPGLTLLKVKHENNGRHIVGLRDPLATQPEQVISQALQDEFNVSFNMRPYISAEPEMLLKRAKNMFKPSKHARFNIQDNTLLVTGVARFDWAEKIQQNWQNIPGINNINMQQLTIDNTLFSQRNYLHDLIEKTVFFFPTGSAHLEKEDQQRLLDLINHIKKLEVLGEETNTGIVISLIPTRTKHDNVDSGLRLKIILNILIENGVPQTILETTTETVASLSENIHQSNIGFQVSFLKLSHNN